MTTIPPEANALITRGNVLEQAGDDGQAEAAYQQAISLLDPDDRGTIGALYINLGTNAQNAGRDADAARFFETAIGYLEGQGGDGLLQSAHAHYNMARLLLDTDDPAAPKVADEARRRYERHPFSSNVDKADAAMLDILSSIWIDQAMTEEKLTHAWRVIRGAPADELDQALLLNFLVNWLEFSAEAHPDTFEALLEDVAGWTPPDTFAGVLGVLAPDE